MIKVTMVEVGFGIQVNEAGGRSIHLMDNNSGAVYEIPFTEEGWEGFMKEAEKDDETLHREREERMRLLSAQKSGLEIPGGADIPAPGPNGEIIDPTEQLKRGGGEPPVKPK